MEKCIYCHDLDTYLEHIQTYLGRMQLPIEPKEKKRKRKKERKKEKGNKVSERSGGLFSRTIHSKSRIRRERKRKKRPEQQPRIFPSRPMEYIDRYIPTYHVHIIPVYSRYLSIEGK